MVKTLPLSIMKKGANGIHPSAPLHDSHEELLSQGCQLSILLVVSRLCKSGKAERLIVNC